MRTGFAVDPLVNLGRNGEASHVEVGPGSDGSLRVAGDRGVRDRFTAIDESDVQITHRRRERGHMRLRVENQGSGGERGDVPQVNIHIHGHGGIGFGGEPR